MARTFDEVDELDDETKHEVIDSIRKYGTAGVDSTELPVQVIDQSTGELGDGTPADVFEVLADVVGRLELDAVMETQGRLIYAKNGIEITLEGFQDRHVLLELKQAQADNPDETDEGDSQ